MFKKITFSIFIILLSFFTYTEAKANSLAGRILLQVEKNGEAYYYHPEKLELFYLGRPNDAFTVMREQGIGISNENLLKIPVADTSALRNTFERVDNDNDGFNDYTELINGYNPYGANKLVYDSNFVKRSAGKIFLQVEANGEAWYINSQDNKRYFLGRPSDAFEIMRTLGLGISNENLDKLLVLNEEEEEEEENIEEEVEVVESSKLIFARNLFSNCQPMSFELMDEGILYQLNNLGLSDSGNYCNIEVSILNDENFVDQNMQCLTPTVNYYLSQLEENGEVSAESVADNDYLNYVSWLPMMYSLDINEHQGEGNCSGSLVALLLENEEAIDIKDSEIVSPELNWQLIDSDYNVDVFSKDNIMYYLKQTNFSGNSAKVALYSYSNNSANLIKETNELVDKVFVDSSNRIWVYNIISGNGLHLLNNGTWYKFSQDNSSLASNNISGLVENNLGLWIATDQGLNLFKNGTWTLFTYLDWYPADNFKNNDVKSLAANNDYVVFKTPFETYIYRDDAFIRLEGISLGSSLYLHNSIVTFFDPLDYRASQINLDDYSSLSIEVNPELAGLAQENFVIKDVIYYQDSFWFLVSPKLEGEDLILLKLENNTAFYYYSKYSQAKYASRLSILNDNLYVLFNNGFGLYEISL